MGSLKPALTGEDELSSLEGRGIALKWVNDASAGKQGWNKLQGSPPLVGCKSRLSAQLHRPLINSRSETEPHTCDVNSTLRPIKRHRGVSGAGAPDADGQCGSAVVNNKYSVAELLNRIPDDPQVLVVFGPDQDYSQVNLAAKTISHTCFAIRTIPNRSPCRRFGRGSRELFSCVLWTPVSS